MSEYLRFKKQPKPVTSRRKTDIYTIYSKSGNILGTIKWYGAWRKYCFYPAGEVVFDTNCLGDIVDFIKELMENRR